MNSAARTDEIQPFILRILRSAQQRFRLVRPREEPVIGICQKGTIRQLHDCAAVTALGVYAHLAEPRFTIVLRPQKGHTRRRIGMRRIATPFGLTKDQQNLPILKSDQIRDRPAVGVFVAIDDGMLHWRNS